MIFVTPVVVLLLAAAITDVRSRRIPNFIPAGIVIFFIAAVMVLPGIDLLGSVAAAIVVFAAGVGLFAAGVVGGGDVKLLAATTLWVGGAGILPLLIAVALAGGVLALVHLTPVAFSYLRTLSAPGATAVREPSSLPYGVAIAAGGAFTIVSQTILT